MIEWTDSGREALEKHLASIRADLLATGLDPETTAALLRQQVEVQLARENISVVTADDVKRVLARGASGPAKPEAAARHPKPVLPGMFGRSVLVVFGVILPLVTLGIELLTHMSGSEFFDPIPTPWHAIAILLVAGANLTTFVALTREAMNPWLRRITAVQGVATGIALFYSLWYAPITPFAVIGIIFLGIGFLALSPLLSLIVALVLRVRLRRKAALLGRAPGGFWPWFGLGLALMVLLELPGLVEAWAVRAAVNGDVSQQARALQVLRQYGDEERILRGCYYHRSDFRHDVYFRFFGGHSMEAQQSVYYRMTGRPFNHRPPPASTWSLFMPDRHVETQEWVWDDKQGGNEVGRRLRALYLTQSRIDGKVEGDAAVGYLEWTMVFRNDHEFQQREARALVQLPAGAVVSRVTLWIDGEEREAAFGGRSQVRQAYQAVVQRRRDPVLVTAAGPGRVLVQCFPVQPKGGEMKIRLGITVPLALASLESGRLTLPRVIEQNYSPAAGLAHAVWIESAQVLSSRLPAYQADSSSSGRQVLRASLTPAQFLSSAAGINVARDPAVTRTWTRNSFEAGTVIEQTIAHEPVWGGPLVIVLDGSENLAEAAGVLAEDLERWPSDRRVQLVVATDSPLIFRTGTPQATAAFLRRAEFVGGQDATRGLLAAMDLLEAGRGTVLWIHGAQPVTWQDTAVLEQRLVRKKGQVRLQTLAAVRGPNVLLEKLGELPDLTVLPRSDEFGADLKQCFARLDGQGWAATRRVVSANQVSAERPEASAHLARLWAADEVSRLLAGGQVNRAAAVKLSVRAQLVTALSGAVVLETQQQYDAAGLQPVDSSTVPSVPEQAVTLVLLLVACVILALVARRVKSKSRPVVAGSR